MDRDKPYNDLPLLPPCIELESITVLRQAIKANKQLAELKGLVKSIPNQEILINSIVLQEARLSSEIENILTTNDELYRAVSNENAITDHHAKEVLRYREGLRFGFEALKNRPLSTNTFIQIAKIINNKDIDIRHLPGTKIANSKNKIIYTPPEGNTIIREKLKNLEDYIHSEDDIDPLIKLAVMHYQFEAIHPFPDGNGRTGRILNILFLVEKDLLETPILFLSRHILRTKNSYYSGLRNVTENNAWIPWIIYILETIEATALDTKQRIMHITAAMEETKEIVQKEAPKIYSKDLIEIIFKHPYSKIAFLEQAEIAKRQTASTYLQTLEKLGLLESIKRGREHYYINKKLMNILSQ